MTDRVNSFTVILEENLRTDDAEPLMDAIRQLRGVGLVQAHVVEPGEAVTRIQVQLELQALLWKVLNP